MYQLHLNKKEINVIVTTNGVQKLKSIILINIVFSLYKSVSDPYKQHMPTRVGSILWGNFHLTDTLCAIQESYIPSKFTWYFILSCCYFEIFDSFHVLVTPKSTDRSKCQCMQSNMVTNGFINISSAPLFPRHQILSSLIQQCLFVTPVLCPQ